jgi:hypothetical protein
MPLTVEHGLAAIAVARSSNEKIGDCATTYAAQASCPSSCAFFNGGGCYAEAGHVYTEHHEACSTSSPRPPAMTPRDVAARGGHRDRRARRQRSFPDLCQAVAAAHRR